MINHIRFCLEMIQKFERRYPQIPTDILSDIVDVVLNRAPALYFSYDQVQEHQELCAKCGNCCRTLNCRYFNGKTCDEHDSRYKACREFPSYDLNNETGLILDCECDFAVRLAETVLEKEFQKNIRLLSLDGEAP